MEKIARLDVLVMIFGELTKMILSFKHNLLSHTQFRWLRFFPHVIMDIDSQIHA